MRINFNTVVKRALTAGAAVGVLMAGYMYFVVEPTVDEAIELEERLAAEDPTDPAAEEEAPLFTRDEQTAGGVAANVIYAVIVSLIFGVVFAKIRHRIPGQSDFTRSVWLALVGFGTIALMPAIKYPANPPAVGDPDTVGERTALYFGVIAVSLVAAFALCKLATALRGLLDRHTQILAVAGSTMVVVGLILVLMPGTPDSIAAEVPADLVWNFRLRSLGSLALLWVGLGVGMGWLLERDAAAGQAAEEQRDLVRS